MTDAKADNSQLVNTVLGPVPADQLGPTAVHESLLSIVPGAEYAPDISIDRAEIFTTLAAKLREFHAAGGRTIVDSTGMFHGRRVVWLENLARATGVNIIASTGMGPEEMLGGYFLTPQTNPPTPWPAAKFADLFTREVTEGMVVPRVERRGPAGLITTTGTRTGLTGTDESLFRGAARAGLATGVAVSLRYGADALAELDIVLDEKLPADRVLVGGMDRRDAPSLEVARRGAYVALDHVGRNDDENHLTDAERIELIAELIAAGHTDRIILSSNAVGVAKGHAPHDLPFGYVLSTFLPQLVRAGVSEADAHRIYTQNPRTLLTVSAR